MDEPTAACRNVLKLCDGYGCAFEKGYAFCCMLEAGHNGPHYDELACGGQTIVIVWHSEKFRVAIASEGDQGEVK